MAIPNSTAEKAKMTCQVYRLGAACAEDVVDDGRSFMGDVQGGDEYTMV